MKFSASGELRAFVGDRGGGGEVCKGMGLYYEGIWLWESEYVMGIRWLDGMVVMVN